MALFHRTVEPLNRRTVEPLNRRTVSKTKFQQALIIVHQACVFRLFVLPDQPILRTPLQLEGILDRHQYMNNHHPILKTVNMKSIQILSCFILFTIFFSSCQKDLITNGEEEESKIVINSFVNNKSEMEVSVTKSFSAFEEPQIEALKDAKVSVYKDDLFLEDLIFSQTEEDLVGKFSSSFIPETVSDYRIEVSHPDYDDIRSKTQVPNGVDISNASVDFAAGNSFNFSFDINDADSTNYYFLKMYFRSYIVDSITQEKRYVAQERIEIPVTSVPDGQRYLDNGYVFKDDTFNGDNATLAGVAKYSRIPESLPFFGGLGDDVVADSTVLYIHLETLTEDAYKYYSSHATYLNTILDVFGENQSIYSNVENGYGIFAGVYVDAIGVEVDF